MADVTNDDLATITEVQAILGGVAEIDTGWRAQSYDGSFRIAWIVRHPPKDCEHGVVLAGGGGVATFAAPPELVSVGDWGLAGADQVHTQIVRFAAGGAVFSLQAENLQDSARPRLVEFARLLAGRVPHAGTPAGLALMCTQADASEVFGAPAGFSNVYEDHVVSWSNAASVEPTLMETLLLQRPVNSTFEENPTIDAPFVSSRSQRTHAPDGTPMGSDAASEVWWEQAGTLYRLSHNRHAYGVTAVPEFLPVEPLLALARRIASRIDEAAG